MYDDELSTDTVISDPLLLSHPTNSAPEPFLSFPIEESVVSWLSHQRYDVRFDGSWIRIGMPTQADSPDTVQSFLDVEPLGDRDVLDELILHVSGIGKKISASLLKAALRKIVRRRKKDRKKEILAELILASQSPLGVTEGEWTKFGMLFDMRTELAVAIGKYVIFQVKQKAINHPIKDHLVPIIFGGEQGSGKTTLVRRIAAPLYELASANVLLSDFADKRSGDLYNYSLVICDDMEQLDDKSVAALKGTITATHINRRILMTSTSATIRQAATLIGTANKPISELINDETGHRRFVMMPFKNGNVAKGGDPNVWPAVNSLDVKMLWDSVDAFGSSPIAPFLAELHHYQNHYRPVPRLLRWLRELDLNSINVKAITVNGGVRADCLRDLYVRETSDVVSKQEFADKMLIYMKDESVPFFEKRKKEIGALYRPRQVAVTQVIPMEELGA